MKNNIVKLELNRKILHLTLNDPENQNTLSMEMILRLQKIFEDAAQDKKVKVIVLSSIGKIFCAGHNLKDLDSKRSDLDEGKNYYQEIFNQCSSLMMKIVNNPKPIIAAVDGIATAAGCQLIASCDLAYASENAKFATPGVNIGLFCSTPMVALSRNVGKKSAMEMLLTGDLIDSSKAKEIGLINNFFNSNQLMNKVFDQAKKISSKSINTLTIGKKAFYKQCEMSIEEAYKYTSSVMTESMLENDAKEGISAFLVKRNPNWDN